MLEFVKFSEYRPGIIVSLLSRSYAEYFQYDPEREPIWRQISEDYDRAVFEYPDTIGACGFITRLNMQVIGYASWDPRQFPVGLVGGNCILPEFRGNSYGTRQIKEVLRVFESSGFVKARVITGEHRFFEPARRMYRACGFREVARGARDDGAEYKQITYEVDFAAVG